jgi:hypothetical protein
MPNKYFKQQFKRKKNREEGSTLIKVHPFIKVGIYLVQQNYFLTRDFWTSFGLVMVAYQRFSCYFSWLVNGLAKDFWVSQCETMYFLGFSSSFMHLNPFSTCPCQPSCFLFKKKRKRKFYRNLKSDYDNCYFFTILMIESLVRDFR